MISELNRTASTLAVYASCRPLGRRRKTRFGWWLAFAGGSSLPQGSDKEFQLFFYWLFYELSFLLGFILTRQTS